MADMLISLFGRLGGYALGLLGVALAAAGVWWGGYRQGQARVDAQALEGVKGDPGTDKGGEETVARVKAQLGEAAHTATAVAHATGGVDAQSDDRVRDIAADRWVRR